MERHEVVIVGAGPAGCAAATLLARRSHRVALVRPSTPPAGALAESVPPSARRLLDELGVLEAVEGGGFFPNGGNTVWWAGREARTETFGEGETGFHVDRAGLEAVLAAAAEAVGARVYLGATARGVERTADGWTLRCDRADGSALRLETPWLIDATGRRGLVARQEGREPDRSTTTLALVQRFRRAGGWDEATRTHTLVESYEDGWAWSVPLGEDVRCVTAMIDQRGIDGAGSDADGLLRAELAKTRHIGPALASAIPVADAWACPASLYTSTRFGRPGLLLAGDAGSFIDPLSSYGVKKALSSGWLAGVVAHTALVDPEMTETAVTFFDQRERTVYRSYRRASIGFFEEAAVSYGSAYWTVRAEAARAAGGEASGTPDDPDAHLPASPPEPRVRAAFEAIRARDRLDAVRGPTVATLERPTVVGQRVVLAEHLASATYPEGLLYVRGVDLRRLVEVAPEHPEVPDGWGAYNGIASPVTLPDYLTALSTAFAAGLLVHRPR